MQTTRRRVLVLVTTVIAGMTGIIATAPSAFAGTVTAPTGNPFVVPGNASGQPQPFTVTASGFPAGSAVFIEQCDGVPATDLSWDPTTNCDLGSSPAAATANGSGVVTFPATDPNFGFKPFKGFSPQGLFNCLGPADPSPNNGLPNFTNCKVRVSTNNSAATADQAFLNIQLPNSVATAPTFTGTPTGATAGQAYSYTFTGITGSPTPTFTMSPVTVAGGITISTAGNLHGIPTTAGSFPITVTAANGKAPNAVRNLTLMVAAASAAKLDCGMSGSVGFIKPLSNIPPKKPKATKAKGSGLLGSAASAACVDHGVPVGTTKYPISAGSVKIKGSLPAGSNCSTLATLPLDGTLLKIKWQGINPKNSKLSTVGKSFATVNGVTKSDPGMYGVNATVTEGPFIGSTARMTLRTNLTHAARSSQCQSAGTASIDFTGTGGASTFSIL